MGDKRATSNLLWATIAAGIFLFQLLVHGVINSQTVSILPTDGCGQVLDDDLKQWLELLLRVSVLSGLCFSVFLAIAKRSMFWDGVLLLSATATITCIFTFGWMNWQFKVLLTSCDIFFVARFAVPWNLFAAILVFISCFYRLKHLAKAV